MTISEALAEIKTIKKRIESKTEFIRGHLYRQDMMRDPLMAEGGCALVNAKAVQAMHDLMGRHVELRVGIAKANSDLSLTILGKTKTVEEWLIWRREIAPVLQNQYMDLRNKIREVRNQVQKSGFQVTSTPAAPQDVIIHLDEMELARVSEELEEILGTLDGKLSLLNATTQI